MSLDTCTVPSAQKEDRIPRGKAELGSGNCGEAGVEQVAYGDARGAFAMVAGKLAPFMPAGRPHGVLLDNLGGASVLEIGSSCTSSRAPRSATAPATSSARRR